MNKETLNKLIRKKVIWETIKIKEKEFEKLQIQINNINNAKSELLSDVQKLMDENQEIAEWLEEKEYEALKNEQNKNAPRKPVVEWLRECLYAHFSHDQQMQFEGLFQQAIEMEKKEDDIKKSKK